MEDARWVPVQVVGVRSTDDETVVLLLDAVDSLLLPIMVGRPEAAAIAAAQAGVHPARPLTHDLLTAVIDALGGRLRRVEIGRLQAGVFHAELVLRDDVRVDSRASDAIAVALRAGVPVLCAASVLASAGMAVEVDASEEDLAQFRDFLDHVSADDFDVEPGADQP